LVYGIPSGNDLDPSRERFNDMERCMRLSTMLPAGGCKGITKLGKPCQGKDVFSNGYCKHHGGQGESLVSRRLKLQIAEELRKSERFSKRMAKWEKRNPAFRRAMEAVRAMRQEAESK
jgi:hypothetical protein